MASIEESIGDRLRAHAGLSALVSTRVYPKRPPQNPTYPLVTHERESAEVVSAMGADTGLEMAVFSVSVRAETYAEILSVAAQVRSALKRYSGTVSSVILQDVYLRTEVDGFDEAMGVHARDLFFEVWFGE